MMRSYEELCAETIAKVKGFGVKSESVLFDLRRAFRQLGAFLSAKGLDFSLDESMRWLATTLPAEDSTEYERNMYLARRRAVFYSMTK